MWQVLSDDLPNNILVHIHIVVNNLGTHPTDLKPGDFRMRRTAFWRNAPRRLSNDLHQMCEGKAQIFVAIVDVLANLLRLADRPPGHV